MKHFPKNINQFLTSSKWTDRFTLPLSLCLIVFTSSCGPAAEEHSEHEELPENIVEMTSDQYKIADIELGGTVEKSMSNLIRVAGKITVPPQNLATVCASFGGYIRSTSLAEGSSVKKGQILAIIENPEFINIQQSYLENMSTLQFMEEEIKRQEKLYKESVGSAKNYQQTRANYESLKATVSGLKQKLALIGVNVDKLTVDNIRSALPVFSPISGFIKSVNVNIGKYVAPTEVMFEIVNTAGLTLEMEVFDKDASLIMPGQEVRFSVLSQPEEEITAKIYQSGKVLDRDNSICVYARINPCDVPLMPGMAVNALIQTEKTTVTALPNEAIVTFDEKNYIFIFKGERKEGDKIVNDFEAIEVGKGITEGGFTEVILPSDFDTKNSKIVIKGAFQVLSKFKNSGEMAC